MKVALVHDWLVSQRGGEAVLEAIAARYPGAPIFTLVHAPGRVSTAIESHPIRTSFIQNLPGAPERFRAYLPLFPRAIESFDFSEFDLVLSTSSCVAKGIRTDPSRQVHVSYVHSPMRYIWDQMPHYLPEAGRWLSVPAFALATKRLRRWDVASAQRATALVANSDYVAARIQRYWGRSAEVIYPPVEVAAFVLPSGAKPERKRYLSLGALVPYKRTAMAVEACTRLGLPLDVVGAGPDQAMLHKLAGPTVRFLGSLPRQEVVRKLQHARALLFCGVEDFGIVPVEATAAGCPVIARGEGGALATVVPTLNGRVFGPEKGALERCLQAFEAEGGPEAYDTAAMVRFAERFDTLHFEQGFFGCVERACADAGLG